MADVCSNCSLTIEKFISCSECSQKWCDICINRSTGSTEESTNIDTARLCPKCISIKREPDTSAMAQDDELCNVHGKPLKQICMDCSICVCGDCVRGKEHRKHSIGSLVVVYQKMITIMEQKLEIAEKELAGSAHESHLAEIQNVVMSTITMTKHVMLNLQDLIATRKVTVKSEIDAIADKRKRLLKLRETAKSLAVKDFVAKRPEIMKQCDNMIDECTTSQYEPQPVEDLKCDLIPPYTFTELICPVFTEKTSTFNVDSTCDVSWKVTFTQQSHELYVKLEPKDIEIREFVHKLIVIFPHPEHPRKEIRKTFDLGKEPQNFCVGDLPHFVKHCFNCLRGSVRIKIGVRPLDVLVEKSLLNYSYRKLKVAHSMLEYDHSMLKADQAKLGKENESLTVELYLARLYFNHHYVSYFYCNLRKWPRNNTNKTLMSNCIFDSDDRMWFLKIVLPSLAGTHIGAFIQLTKGTPGTFYVFIELEHGQPEKTVRQRKSFPFDQGMCYGWENFAPWKQIETGGYQQDQILRFRFGVQSIMG